MRILSLLLLMSIVEIKSEVTCNGKEGTEPDNIIPKFEQRFKNLFKDVAQDNVVPPIAVNNEEVTQFEHIIQMTRLGDEILLKKASVKGFITPMSLDELTQLPIHEINRDLFNNIPEDIIQKAPQKDSIKPITLTKNKLAKIYSILNSRRRYKRKRMNVDKKNRRTNDDNDGIENKTLNNVEAEVNLIKEIVTDIKNSIDKYETAAEKEITFKNQTADVNADMMEEPKRDNDNITQDDKIMRTNDTEEYTTDVDYDTNDNKYSTDVTKDISFKFEIVDDKHNTMEETTNDNDNTPKNRAEDEDNSVEDTKKDSDYTSEDDVEEPKQGNYGTVEENARLLQKMLRAADDPYALTYDFSSEEKPKLRVSW